MINWLKSKFIKHRYIPIKTTSTGGTKYKCLSCKDEYYLPLDWSYLIDIKKVRGCKNKHKNF